MFFGISLTNQAIYILRLRAFIVRVFYGIMVLKQYKE